MLFVGSIFNRRRLPTLITAFAAATATRPDARLVIAGADRSYPALDLAGLAAEAGVGGRVEIRNYVHARRSSTSLYARAAVFVFLSEYEGFGLTPLEALSAGVPIVVLDTPVAREVYGDAAWYVPRDGDVRQRDERDPHAARGSGERARRCSRPRRRCWRATRGTPRPTQTLAAIEGIVAPVSRRCRSYRQLQRARGPAGLPAVAEEGAARRCDHEIIVVDNESTDGSAEAARADSRACASSGWGGTPASPPPTTPASARAAATCCCC